MALPEEFKRRARERLRDGASATLVTAIISMLFICLCAGFSIDVGKNAYLKNVLDSRAQQAAEIALKDLDSRGSIKSTAPAKLVQTFNSLSDKASGGSGDEFDNYRTTGCSTGEVTTWSGGKATVNLPYIVVRLDLERKIGTTSTVVYVSQGGGAPQLVSGTYSPTAKYRVLAVDVQDAAPNFMLSMFGMACQKFRPQVSAIAFGSAGDLGAEPTSAPTKPTSPATTGNPKPTGTAPTTTQPTQPTTQPTTPKPTQPTTQPTTPKPTGPTTTKPPVVDPPPYTFVQGECSAMGYPYTYRLSYPDTKAPAGYTARVRYQPMDNAFVASISNNMVVVDVKGDPKGSTYMFYYWVSPSGVESEDGFLMVNPPVKPCA